MKCDSVQMMKDGMEEIYSDVIRCECVVPHILSNLNSLPSSICTPECRGQMVGIIQKIETELEAIEERRKRILNLLDKLNESFERFD